MSLLEIEMSLYEAILARRSVRSYTTQKLEKGAVSSLLEAAIRAPTAMHGEPWAFVIIQDQQLLKKISDQAKPMLLTMMHHNQHQHALKLFELPVDQDFNIFYDAGTLILICGNTKIKFFGGGLLAGRRKFNFSCLRNGAWVMHYWECASCSQFT